MCLNDIDHYILSIFLNNMLHFETFVAEVIFQDFHFVDIMSSNIQMYLVIFLTFGQKLQLISCGEIILVKTSAFQMSCETTNNV